ncbi:MAG: hypothetical protein V3V13_14155 [Paracoccaceae bacterium]
MAASSLPIAVWIGLILTPVTISIGQILFKLVSGGIEEFSIATVARLALDPLFILAISIYAAATILWIFVLRAVPLSIAYSFMGITYMTVPVLSALFLNETLSLRSFIGAALIISGVLVVNS